MRPRNEFGVGTTDMRRVGAQVRFLALAAGSRSVGKRTDRSTSAKKPTLQAPYPQAHATR